MSPLVFNDILAAAQRAQEWAWTEIYSWLAPQLGGYFRVRGFRDPEDLVGEVFVQLARNLVSFRGDLESFKSWVFMIAHNRLANERRRMGRKPQTPTEDMAAVDSRHAASAEEEALTLLDQDRVEFLLEGLTADQRDVLALRVVAGFSLEETAGITGKTLGAVKQLQRRGLKTLRGEIVAEDVTI